MKLAALRYGPDQGAAADDLLVRLAHQLKRNGVKICGAVQHNQANGDRSCEAMELEDPVTGVRVQICENIPEAIAECRIDNDALSLAVAWSDAGLSAGAELLIINKFGKREAKGDGFAPVIRRAVDLGVPVIAGVSDRNFEAWNALAGVHAAALPPDYTMVLEWCENCVALQQEEFFRARVSPS